MCEGETLAAQPLRRLSSTQYQNTITDLFGDALAADLIKDSLFPATVIKAGFSADAEANIVSSSESHAIEDNAEKIAATILSSPQPFLHALLPCDHPGTIVDADVDSCIDDFIDSFGERAYRRPVTSQEHGVVRDLYDTIRETQSATAAWSSTIQLFVQSPALLYRVERGVGAPLAGLVRLSDHELASRLSYLFTDSMPDDALLEAARAGQLHTRAQIQEQAARLMQGPRFLKVVAAFHRDWLHLYDLERVPKDEALFPEFTPELKASLMRESAEYVRYVLEEGDGSLHTLLAGTTLPVDANLSALYGVDAPSDDGFSPVAMPDRRGLLTQASFMAATSKADRTNPIHRGAFVQREILCRQLPGLPGNTDISTPLKSTASMPTARERFAPLLQDQPCKGCHTLFNPTGLAFEEFDAIGRHRDEENGMPIDSAGSIDLGQGSQPFDSALKLIDLVADSRAAADCYSLQWYRAALGRREVAEDTCTLEAVQQATQQSNGDLRELLLAVIGSDTFLFRRAEEE